MKRYVPLFALAFAAALSFAPQAFADSVTCVLPHQSQVSTDSQNCTALGGTPKQQQGGACTSTAQCAGNLTCQSGFCNMNYSCTAPCGAQNGGVQPGGQCAYNADCADQGSQQYSCLDGTCKPDQGSVTAGSPCEVYADGSNNCYGNLACISGTCQIDSSLQGSGTGAGPSGLGSGPTGGTVAPSGSGGINMTYLKGYSAAILMVINTMLVPILLALAFLMFLWGVYKYFIQGAESEGEKRSGQKFVMWSIIGFVVIFSLWGLVALVGSTFGLSAGVGAPPPPKL